MHVTTYKILPGGSTISTDSFTLYRLVSPGSEDDGMQIQFKVVSPASISLSSQHRPPATITIGSVPVSRKATWEDLDKKTCELFLVIM